MQTISANLKSALLDIDARVTPRVLVDLTEFYAADYVPGISGFDPDDAIERFAAEEITWNGNAYRREQISRGDITRSMGEKTNSVTLTFSNISRYMATLAHDQAIEGLFLVIRCVVPTVEDDSLVLFVGRCDKPSDIDKKKFTLNARQDFGNINQTLPTAQFVAEDPNGRVPGDLLYEGIRFIANSGSFTYTTRDPSTSFFGALFHRKKTVQHTTQWSSIDSTPYGSAINEVFGRCQIRAVPIMFRDTGFWLEGLWVWCKGPIASVENIALKSFASYGIYDVQTHTGEIGGTGLPIVRNGLVPQTGGNITQDFRFPTAGVFSLLAFTGLSILQSGLNDEPITIEEPPVVVGLVRGRRIDVPNSSGVYNSTAWSDNPVHVARFILTNERFVGINPAFMEDAVNYLTSLHCDEAIIDDSNGEVTLLPSTDQPLGGSFIRRFVSTGIINWRWFRYRDFGDLDQIPGFEEAIYTSFNLNDIPSTFAIQGRLRRRYTVSFPITDEVRAVDLLYKTVNPAAKLFLRVNKRGKYEIRTERPSDNTMITSAVSVGATAIQVLDVTPWTLQESSASVLIPALVDNWYLKALVRHPTSPESSSAVSTLISARNTGISTYEASAATLLKAVFLSAEYVARARTNTQFVGDIYKAYMIRTGEPGGITFWSGRVAIDGRSAVLDAFGSSPEFHQRIDEAILDLSGRIHLGFGLTTSEVRTVSSALYSTAGNSVTLSASATGGVTATASGGTLSGGTTMVQASGTITIGGTPAAGNTVTATINGVACVHTLDANDTTGTTAAMLASWINATPQLRRYVQAVWVVGSPTVVTIRSKHGTLNVDSALLQPHTAPISDPATTPSLASSAGALGAGGYKVAYADVTALGKSALSPMASITITASKKIDVGAIGLVGVSRNWYMSVGPNSAYLKYVANTNGSAFSINALPLPDAALPPTYNATGEELIRVAMSFATNSQDIFPAWLPSISTLLTEVYLPTTPNGHKYTVTTQGTTGTAEPTWPTTAGATVSNGTVVFTESGATYLGQSGLTRANIKKDTFTFPLGSRQSSVNQIKISYRDSNNDFALTPYRINDRVHQAQVNKAFPLEVDGSAIDNFNQMFRIANWQLAKNREGDWFYTFGTGPQGLVLEEGDVICASDDSGGLVNQVTRIEDLRIHPNHDVTIGQARKYSTLMFSDEVGSDIIPVPSTLRHVQTVNSSIEFIDTSSTRDGDELIPGFFVSVSRDLSVLGDWRGWALYADYGDGYVTVAQGDIPAVIGVATTTLGTVSDFTLFDTVSSLTFTLKYGPPAPAPPSFGTVTQADLDANPRRNLFLVKDEYIQTATVVDNGNQSFTISHFYRGRFDTSTTELVHGSGERVVYVDGSEVFVPTDVSRIGIPYNYKAVTTNQDVDDATPVSFTWRGNLIRPLRVSDVIITKDASNDFLIQFTGHPRPNEMPANYAVDVWDGTGRVDPATHRKRILPVTEGSTHAVLLRTHHSVSIIT